MGEAGPAALGMCGPITSDADSALGHEQTLTAPAARRVGSLAGENAAEARPMCHGGIMRVTGLDACRARLGHGQPVRARGARGRPSQGSGDGSPGRGASRAPNGPGWRLASRWKRSACTRPWRRCARRAPRPGGRDRHAAGAARIGLARGGPGGARAARAQAQLGLCHPPRAVWEQASYQAASQRCRELTGQGLSIQACRACGPGCSRPTGTAAAASTRSTRCTPSWPSAPWRARRSSTASTPRRAASCAVSC